MNKEYKVLLNSSCQKVLSAVDLVEASLTELDKYSVTRNYTPKELEPYDALSDRFIRAVETCIKFFKTYEYYLFAVPSDSYRELLLQMEKKKMISSVEKWIDMRDIRNRIVHDYLPNQIERIYELIMGEFSEELFALRSKIKDLNINLI